MAVLPMVVCEPEVRVSGDLVDGAGADGPWLPRWRAATPDVSEFLRKALDF